MSGDYKYEMQMRAEEIAEERFSCDFYDLPQDRQYAVFKEAMEDWTEALYAKADFLNDAAKERGLKD